MDDTTKNLISTATNTIPVFEEATYYGPYINQFGPTVQKVDVQKDIIDKNAEHDEQIQNLKDIVNVNEVRLLDHEMKLNEIRNKVEETLMIVKYPGLIANRVLDKLDAFIAKHKKGVTDSNGNFVDIIELKDLNDALKQLREVIKNDSKL